jgi:hypothetical protein
MLGTHFELSWDGNQCILRDLGNMKGTLVGGQAVKEAAVRNGEWIHAGATDFSVHIEGLISPLYKEEDEEDDEEDEDDEEERALRRERLAERARERAERAVASERALVALRAEAENGRLYAVLDAARDKRILELLRQHVEECRSLYEGIQGESLAEVAPYLAGPMQRGSKLLDALVREGWGKRWGIYLTSESGFKEVRRHLRRFLMVEDEGTGETLYFRFYDPWVMASFWPVCTERQTTEILGNGAIDKVYAEQMGKAQWFVAAGP